MKKHIISKGFHSLRVRISLLLILAAVLLTAATSAVALTLFTAHTCTAHLDTARGVAKIAANLINADEIETYKREGKSVAGYEDTFIRLSDLQKNTPDIEYLYVYQIREDGCHIIFDTDEESVGREIDDLVEFDPTFLPLVPDLLLGKEIAPIESNDQFGWLLTYYHPVFDSNGNCQCYVGVDISMNLLKAYRTTFLYRTVMLSVIAVIIIIGAGLLISTKFLVNPINTIARHAGAFMNQNGNVDGMKACVSQIKSLKVRTGDEVENLYVSFSAMTENTVKNIIEIHRMQQEQIELMKRYQTELEQEVEERTHELKLEKERSENLLLNILPKPIADELTEHPDRTIAKSYPNATVLFTDIVGFTKMSGKMTAKNVVAMLNLMISRFDERAKRMGIEKIKTIGDAYMAATGLTEQSDTAGAERMVKFAQGLLEDVTAFNAKYNTKIQIPVGINTGELVAGVIGKSKFIYDIWGDTVNVASRMESTGEPMKIHVSESTHAQTARHFAYGEGIEVEVKGKGKMRTYYL